MILLSDSRLAVCSQDDSIIIYSRSDNGYIQDICQTGVHSQVWGVDHICEVTPGILVSCGQKSKSGSIKIWAIFPKAIFQLGYIETGDTYRLVPICEKSFLSVGFDGSLNISKLKSFIETSIIPRLRNNKFIINGKNIDTKSNEFVRRLTFGKHNGESIFKLPFNMSEIDSNPGIKQEYEKILQSFGELRNIHLEGGLTVVDVFYLYNLIVHKDHFGRNSLTRLFEDLISSKKPILKWALSKCYFNISLQTGRSFQSSGNPISGRNLIA
jgi:hypothetical protein